MEKRKWLAAALLALLGVPLLVYTGVNIIRSYIPPSEPWFKTPAQFEEAFNARMEPVGLCWIWDAQTMDMARAAR